MKIKSVFRLFLFSSISCTSYGALLSFPVSGVTSGTPLSGDWTQSDGAVASDQLAWYATIGSAPVQYEGVSVGALYNDYAGITDGGFTVSANTDAVAVGGATIDWHFAINPSNNGFSTSVNDYSISLFDTSNSNVLTINLTNINASQWSASANGNSMGLIEVGGFYALQATFGAVSGFDVAIIGDGTLSYSNTSFDPAGKTFKTVQVGIAKGSATDYGDGFITVVPEPSSTMLISLLPAFFVIRRRR